MTSDTTTLSGSRSSPISTPASRDPGGIRTCSRSAEMLVQRRRLDVDLPGRLIVGQPEPPGHQRQGRRLQAGEDDDEDQDDVEEELRPLHAARPAGWWPARSAPRRGGPAQDRKTCSRSGTRNQTAEANDRQRAGDQGEEQAGGQRRPGSAAGRSAPGRRAGRASRTARSGRSSRCPRRRSGWRSGAGAGRCRAPGRQRTRRRTRSGAARPRLPYARTDQTRAASG